MNLKSFFKKNSRRWAITDKMLFSLFLTGSIIEFSQVGAGFIDGLVISRFLGPEAMAAQGIVQPIYSILGVISGLLAVGMEVRCAQSVGCGNRDDFSRFFSVTAYVGSIASLVMMVLVTAFARPFTMLLGASGNGAELIDSASKYLIGVGIGIPPLIMVAVLAPALQLDSGRKTVQIGALIGAVANVIMDLLTVKMNMGIFGVGVSTAVATYLNLLYQCMHFLKKERMLHFIRPNVPVREFLLMLANGGEKAIKRLANTVRPIILNTVIIAYGGTAAMSALSVRNNFSDFAEIFGAGIAAAISLLVGLYYGEINEEAIDEVSSYGQKLIYIFSGSICVLLLLFARPVARLYVTGEGRILDMATFGIQMLALQNPLQALISSRIKYLQAIHRKLNMNLLIFGSKLVFVLISAFALGKLFGVYGILAAYTASDALSLLAVYILYRVKTHKVFPSRRDFLNLPDDFYLSPGDVISLDIRGMNDVSLASEQIMLFCRGHRVERKTAYFSALCFEELAANVVEYGFPNNRSAHPIIDLRVVITENKFVIRMRDDCPQYDITKQIAVANAADADPAQNIGIRIVSKLASDIRYVHAFETNSLIISFDL